MWHTPERSSTTPTLLSLMHPIAGPQLCQIELSFSIQTGGIAILHGSCLISVLAGFTPELKRLTLLCRRRIWVERGRNQL